MDHFYQISGVGPEDASMLEAYSTLAAIAARTSRSGSGARQWRDLPQSRTWRRS